MSKTEYMKEHNIMWPISGMTMSGKTLVETNEKTGKVQSWMPIPEETLENRKIYNDFDKQLKEEEYKIWWGREPYNDGLTERERYLKSCKVL